MTTMNFTDKDLVERIMMLVEDLNAAITLCKSKGIRHVVTTDHTSLTPSGMSLEHIKVNLFKVLV